MVGIKTVAQQVQTPPASAQESLSPPCLPGPLIKAKRGSRCHRTPFVHSLDAMAVVGKKKGNKCWLITWLVIWMPQVFNKLLTLLLNEELFSVFDLRYVRPSQYVAEFVFFFSFCKIGSMSCRNMEEYFSRIFQDCTGFSSTHLPIYSV